jgi:arylsulfatase A-like enzyme
MIHVENELIDQACGRVLARIAERGWEPRTDVFFTTDHGELQGDFGLLYKGPYHVDALMRLPMIWRPAPSAKIAHNEIAEPVGQLDLAPTFCQIAGVPVPGWMQGKPLPIAPGSGRQRVITEWDSQFAAIGMHLRSIYRDGYTLTVYEKSTRDYGFDIANIPAFLAPRGPIADIRYDGTEGELYNLREDPMQWRNLWDDPAYAKLKSDLRADLYDNLPPERKPKLPIDAPA